MITTASQGDGEKGVASRHLIAGLSSSLFWSPNYWEDSRVSWQVASESKERNIDGDWSSLEELWFEGKALPASLLADYFVRQGFLKYENWYRGTKLANKNKDYFSFECPL